MDITLGSNNLRNTNGVFTAQGKDLLWVEIGEKDGPPIVSMDVYTPTGAQVAKLERNVWQSNEKDRYEFTIESPSVKVVDTILKQVVIEVKKEDEHRLVVPLARFYSVKGTLSEVTHDWWRVGNTMELKGTDLDLEGGHIEIAEEKK